MQPNDPAAVPCPAVVGPVTMDAATLARSARQLFASCDGNQDGQLDASELKTVREAPGATVSD